MGMLPLRHVLNHLRPKAGGCGNPGDSDATLVERFARRADAGAFEMLLARHGALVWAVCRRQLEDVQDAEDAFQATFVVFAKRAGSIRRPERLANWLYGVARRVARRQRALTVRRRSRECAPVEGLPARGQEDVVARDLGRVIDEELDRLPERYRLPVLLCYVEGLSQEQAARQLGWPAGAFRGRLDRARERLKQRLVRRGLAPAVALSIIATETHAATVPPTLFASTLRTVQLVTSATGTSASLAPAVADLSQGVLHAMFLTKAKIALGVLLVVGTVSGGAGVITRLADDPGPAAPAQAAVPREKAPVQAVDEAAGQEPPIPEIPPIEGLPAQRVKALTDQLPPNDPMSQLLKDQYAAAREEAEARRKEFMAGRGTLDIMIDSSKRLLQAELDLSSKNEDRSAALAEHVKRMKEAEVVNRFRFNAGRIAIQDYSQSRFNRIRAEIWLARYNSTGTLPADAPALMR